MNDWRKQKACGSTPPETFFPGPGQGGVQARAKARAICNACPVAIECLTFALKAELGEPSCFRHGIFGGLDGRERWELDRSTADDMGAEGVA